MSDDRSSDTLPSDTSAKPPSAEASESVVEHVEMAELARRVEALLFVSNKPLAPRRIAELLGVASIVPIRQACDYLESSYEGHAFQLSEVGGGYQIVTRPELEETVVLLQRQRRAQKLTPAALETLAVIAYKQPVTRAELDNIRGVASDHHLRTLMERDLVRVSGRMEVQTAVGTSHAAQYGTTTTFLNEFGLKSISELPSSDDLAPPKQDFSDRDQNEAEDGPENFE